MVNGQWQVLVKWLGYDALEATWEPLEDLQKDVPVLVQKAVATSPHVSFVELKAHLAASPAS